MVGNLGQAAQFQLPTHKVFRGDRYADRESRGFRVLQIPKPILLWVVLMVARVHLDFFTNLKIN